jgi:hypothetical protein
MHEDWYELPAEVGPPLEYEKLKNFNKTNFIEDEAQTKLESMSSKRKRKHRVEEKHSLDSNNGLQSEIFAQGQEYDLLARRPRTGQPFMDLPTL